MFSKDADLNKIKDDRFISMTILGTEGVADRQDGRKPGGVVNGSVVKEVTETGPMYMSDPRPRVCRSPMSSPSRVLNKVEGYATTCQCWSFHDPPAQDSHTMCSFLHQSSLCSLQPKDVLCNKENGYHCEIVCDYPSL